MVNWVTKGLFVGQRRVYMNPQPDDTMIADDMWDPATQSGTTGKTYRITGSDYNKLWAWQSRLNASTPNAAGIRIEHAFNGFGTSAAYPVEQLFPATTDDLTPTIYNEENWFHWVSHTYSHPNLDSITYSQMLTQLRQNNTVALNTIGMTNYTKDSLVTPEISWLNNA